MGGHKKRVAAYIRVSTALEEQAGSFLTQFISYKKMIESHSNWELVDIFGDKGKSGTETTNRVNFNRLIDCARTRQIDLILTKSISRFSRNALDVIEVTRELRSLGVEVYFEENHLSSLDPKCELMLSILGGIAQEESRNLSENIKWGIKRNMEKGKFTIPYNRFLGYKKGKNGKPEILKREARTIREIYMLFLSGRKINQIAHYLNRVNRKAPGGKVWYYNTVFSILTNEKYAGIALLQKTFTPDYLSHKSKRNTGELNMYLVHYSHPAIIDLELFKKIQYELMRRGYKVFWTKMILDRL